MSETLRMRPGGELTDVMDGLGLQEPRLYPARDVLCFLAGRDPEAFVKAVAHAAPDLLPDRIRDALDLPNGGPS